MSLLIKIAILFTIVSSITLITSLVVRENYYQKEIKAEDHYENTVSKINYTVGCGLDGCKYCNGKIYPLNTTEKNNLNGNKNFWLSIPTCRQFSYYDTATSIRRTTEWVSNAALITLLFFLAGLIVLVIVKHSMFVKYRIGARRLLNECNYYIKEYEAHSSNRLSSCQNELLSEIKKRIKKDKKNLASWQKNDADFTKIAHSYIANTSFDMLASERNHRDNKINPMTRCCLIAVYNEAMFWAEQNGFIDEKLKEDCHKEMLESISSSQSENI